MEKTVELGVKHGKRVVLNPAPASPVKSEIFKKVFLVTPNENEAEEISGVMRSDYSTEEWRKRAASSLHELGAKNVILTLGDAGAYYSSEGKELFVKAFAIKPEDSTAAGDAFNGALCYALALGKSVEEAVVWGNAAGALAVSRIGSQSSLCTMEELSAFLKKNNN
jgi:ribokinase